MRPDPNDVDFIDNIKRLIGIDAKGVEALLPKLDPDVLIDLAAAVTNNDAGLVRRLIVAGRRKAMSEQRLLDHAPRGRQRKNQYDTGNDGGFAVLSVGDNVKANGETGTVKLPKAPGNTVGVMIKGNLEMIDRKDVSPVTEGVFGMTAIPDLRRMQELAGIATDSMSPGAGPDADVGLPDGDPAVIDLTPPSGATLSGAGMGAAMGRPTALQPEGMGDDDSAACGGAAMALLDQLAAMLPDLRLADIKSIRQRINDITAKMNETVGFAGRQAVVESRRRKRI